MQLIYSVISSLAMIGICLFIPVTADVLFQVLVISQCECYDNSLTLCALNLSGVHQIVWASQVELVVKNLPTNEGDAKEASSIPGSGRSPGEEHGKFLPGGFDRRRSLAGYSPQGHKELDTTTEVIQHACPRFSILGDKELPLPPGQI